MKAVGAHSTWFSTTLHEINLVHARLLYTSTDSEQTIKEEYRILLFLLVDNLIMWHVNKLSKCSKHHQGKNIGHAILAVTA